MYVLVWVLSLSVAVLAAPLPYRETFAAYTVSPQPDVMLPRPLQATQQVYAPRRMPPVPYFYQHQMGVSMQGNRELEAKFQGYGVIYGQPYNYGRQAVAYMSSGINSGTNTISGTRNLVNSGSNVATNVGTGNSINTGTNTVTLKVNGKQTHTVGTGPITLSRGGTGGAKNNTINAGTNTVSGTGNTAVTGGNAITRTHSGNSVNTGNNNFVIDVDPQTYKLGKTAFYALGGKKFLDSSARAVQEFLTKLGISVNSNQGGTSGAPGGHNTINSGTNTVSGTNNNVHSGSNTINTHRSDNTLNTGHNTVKFKVTNKKPSINHSGTVNHSTGTNKVNSGTNNVSGTGNNVQSGQNTINSVQSGHTVQTGNNTITVGGLFKLVKQATGWQLVRI